MPNISGVGHRNVFRWRYGVLSVVLRIVHASQGVEQIFQVLLCVTAHFQRYLSGVHLLQHVCQCRGVHFAQLCQAVVCHQISVLLCLRGIFLVFNRHNTGLHGLCSFQASVTGHNKAAAFAHCNRFPPSLPLDNGSQQCDLLRWMGVWVSRVRNHFANRYQLVKSTKDLYTLRRNGPCFRFGLVVGHVVEIVLNLVFFLLSCHFSNSSTLSF